MSQGLVIAGRCRGTFERCVISDCRSAGIRLRNDARPLLRGNLVVGCQGPGMVAAGSSKIPAGNLAEKDVETLMFSGKMICKLVNSRHLCWFAGG